MRIEVDDSLEGGEVVIAGTSDELEGLAETLTAASHGELSDDDGGLLLNADGVAPVRVLVVGEIE